ncbi:hypothetical protein GGX14DRAFT_540650 [Mycena pura]|uniref:Uncharacterized protein n=1 Tax=Mycena pura TaxID=153505 RepID=A0AAD6VW13_9AGAR|nr:hypothetical protein GGX14DRAFT_540650 [Mycena pura]
MVSLRNEITKIDNRFATKDFKFIFQGEATLGSDTVKNFNVLVETLRAGVLGLPTTAEPTYNCDYNGNDIPILHPRILLLTKMSRWSRAWKGTKDKEESEIRPQTLFKIESDERDLKWLINWMGEKKMTIEFADYAGRNRLDLVAIVRDFYTKFSGNEALIAELKSIMKKEDWDAL